MAATCKACGASIVWIKTTAGKWMPCDEGLVEYKAGDSDDFEDLVVKDNGEVVRCTFDFQCRPDGVARIPHWATCPKVDRFKRAQYKQTSVFEKEANDGA